MPINVQSQGGETQVIVTPQPAHQIEIRRVGVQGATGASIYVGSGAPTSPSKNGDLYIDTATGNLYKWSG